MKCYYCNRTNIARYLHFYYGEKYMSYYFCKRHKVMYTFEYLFPYDNTPYIYSKNYIKKDEFRKLSPIL